MQPELTPSPPSGNQDRFLIVQSDGTVVWESPAGWAAGAHLVEFVQLEARTEFQTALSSITLGLRDRVALRSGVVDTAGTWNPAEITMVRNPPVEGRAGDSVLVAIRELPPHGVVSLAPMTSTDDLTSLGDRSALNARIQSAEESGGDRPMAILYVDVDLFKQVNDQLGHTAGDKVLQAVADRLRNTVRPGDLVTRLGGDEFVVVAGGVGTDEAALEIAERIRTNVAEPVAVGSRRANATVSIGVAVGEEQMATLLLEHADAALYRAKDLGRNQAQLYRSTDVSMRRRVTEPEALLRSALDDGLVIVYEPVCSVESEQLISVEASLRLRAEGGRLEPPDDLLRLAERSGLMVSIGAGMLDLACRELASWSADTSDFDGRAPSLTWPVSTRQLDEPRGADQVLRILSGYSVKPDQLVLQLSERSLVSPGSNARRNLDQLHGAGVSLAVGDFGAGPASLAALLQFSFDVLKLDPTFMSGFGDDRHNTDLVKAILAFGRNLGVRTVARGVASRSQLELLRYMGCDEAQGPVFAPSFGNGGPIPWTPPQA